MHVSWKKCRRRLAFFWTINEAMYPSVFPIFPIFFGKSSVTQFLSKVCLGFRIFSFVQKWARILYFIFIRVSEASYWKVAIYLPPDNFTVIRDTLVFPTHCSSTTENISMVAGVISKLELEIRKISSFLVSGNDTWVCKVSPWTWEHMNYWLVCSNRFGVHGVI